MPDKPAFALAIDAVNAALLHFLIFELLGPFAAGLSSAPARGARGTFMHIPPMPGRTRSRTRDVEGKRRGGSGERRCNHPQNVSALRLQAARLWQCAIKVSQSSCSAMRRHAAQLWLRFTGELKIDTLRVRYLALACHCKSGCRQHGPCSSWLSRGGSGCGRPGHASLLAQGNLDVCLEALHLLGCSTRANEPTSHCNRF